MIRALIFDFDGLILDTEVPEYRAWQTLYAAHNCELPLEDWSVCVGASADAFDAVDYLENLLGTTVDRAALRAEHKKHQTTYILEETVRPGILDTINAARERHLKLAIASSSPRHWIEGHLERLGLQGRFDAIVCADDVEHVKPDPAVYQGALAALDIAPSEAIAFEDSVNGARAAKQAGIFCVVIPNDVTRNFHFDGHADRMLDSLADVSLDELLTLVNDQSA